MAALLTVLTAGTVIPAKAVEMPADSRSNDGGAGLIFVLPGEEAAADATSAAEEKKAREKGGEADQPAAAETDLERQVRELVDAERKKKGLPPLTFAADLLRVARTHSQVMAEAGKLFHRDPKGRGPGDRLEAVGIEWRAFAENVASNSGTGKPAESAVLSWMKSAGHRTNILNQRYRETAIGVAMSGKEKKTYYFTQLFLTRPGDRR